MVDLKSAKLEFFNKKSAKKAMIIGEAILGVPQSQLGIEFIEEMDRYILTLDSFLHKDIKTLFWLFCSRFSGLVFGRSLRPFTKMSEAKKSEFLKRWMYSRIPILRTGFSTLRALASWGYYSLDKSFEEIKFQGSTIGKENILPTLLQGKEPLDPKSYLEEYP